MSFLVDTHSPSLKGRLPCGSFRVVEGELQYCIENVDRLPPFLLNVVSDSDWWLYVSSGGGLTAGRRTAEQCLLPYETVDRLHDAPCTTGPITLLQIDSIRGQMWQPFAPPSVSADTDVSRSLSKNLAGNQILFDERHHELDLSFSYSWTAVDAFGLVRKSQLVNHGELPRTIRILDGLRNVMPWGVPLATYQGSSCLVDAYRRAEFDRQANLGVYHLTAMISDRMYPAEALRANLVWCCGLPPSASVALDPRAITLFRTGRQPPRDRELTGRKASYLVIAGPLTLQPGETLTWYMVGDVGCDHVRVAAIRAQLTGADELPSRLEEEIVSSTNRISHIVARADGCQRTADQTASFHHWANTLFNVMRGGVVWRDHEIPKQDFGEFLQQRNRDVSSRTAAALGLLPDRITMSELAEFSQRSGDLDLERLTDEFLPVTFSRRHGHPSRPWNRFTVRVLRDDRTPALHYEGNWRDIFQNWEALAASFPAYLEKMIAKFVNGSTVDGFNPYRVTSEGLEWEVPDPDDPWSNIGYWGDHQLIYLLKFLEGLYGASPARLQAFLDEQRFVYFLVPYRLRAFDELKRDPRATIDFDQQLATELAQRVDRLGEDGKLLLGDDQEIYYVTLWEKLLVPVLSKLSNFVIGGGIWMNTQRPEWNDANNALVGYGVSLVTLCYLRRYVAFLSTLLPEDDRTVMISREVVTWLRQITQALEDHRPLLDQASEDDAARLSLLDALGGAFSAFREQVYPHGMSGQQSLPTAEVRQLLRLAGDYAEHTIRLNRRPDGLFHAYNLIEFHAQGAAVRQLYEMLEGQVAVLSAGVLSHAEAIDLLQALYVSRLYCPDQNSFLLYPDRELPDFLERNVVPEPHIDSIPLLRALVEAGDTSVIARDVTGVHRFQGDLSQSADVAAALDRLAAKGDPWQTLVDQDGHLVLELFGQVFGHRAFTGRSGTMYGYEGLGCIYWHMVAKLLLAVQEQFWRAIDEGEAADTIRAWRDWYYRVRGGLGFEKSPSQFGAFPTDPYSHTPKHAGAQQPGMTGQVKEEILTRFGELGVRVVDGRLRFQPQLLRRAEFMPESREFHYYDVEGEPRVLKIPAHGLAYTYCQTPIVYRLAEAEQTITVRYRDGREEVVCGGELSDEVSRGILFRTREVSSLHIDLPSSAIFVS